MDWSIGCRLLQLDDAVQGAVIPLALLYPAVGAERVQRFGPYTVDLAREAPPIGENLPLIVVSHGNNGTPWVYRDLAASLVRAGFIVALPEHIGNSRSDGGLEGTAANLENRPRHVSLAIDAAFADGALRDRLAPNGVGVVGHSIGGYAALAAAGGRPWAAPHETADGKAHPVPVTPDPRLRAVVLLAPATFWFVSAGALAGVRVPILMRTGASDEITPVWHAEVVKRGVPDPALVEHQEIPGAGHFSFMSKFPPAMTRSDFPPSQDPPGFDRADLQPSLHADILEFLRRALL